MEDLVETLKQNPESDKKEVKKRLSILGSELRISAMGPADEKEEAVSIIMDRLSNLESKKDEISKEDLLKESKEVLKIMKSSPVSDDITEKFKKQLEKLESDKSNSSQGRFFDQIKKSMVEAKDDILLSRIKEEDEEDSEESEAETMKIAE